MVGELHEAHRDLDINQQPTALPAMLKTWLGGTPAGLDLAPSASAAALVTRLRRTLADFRGKDKKKIRGVSTGARRAATWSDSSATS